MINSILLLMILIVCGLNLYLNHTKELYKMYRKILRYIRNEKQGFGVYKKTFGDKVIQDTEQQIKKGFNS